MLFLDLSCNKSRPKYKVNFAVILFLESRTVGMQFSVHYESFLAHFYWKPARMDRTYG